MASETLFGVLLDVSRSMESAYALDRSHDASVPRIHSIFTTIVNIIRREVARRDRRDSIFACTFGLETYTCGPSCTGICDMISLLDCPKDGHQALVDLARKEEAPHAERWIKNQLSHSEAQILYTILCRDRRSTLELIELLPRRVTTAATDAASWAGNAAEKVPLFGWLFAKPVNDWAGKKMERKVSDSEAYKFTHKMIDKFWQQQPRPRPVREVSEKLEKLLGDPSTTSSQSIHDQIDEFVKQIEPFIFGRTPMRKALKDAQAVFRHANEKQKVLCIISDGDSTDGDPRYIAQNLREKGVDIATCFLTSDHIGKPRRLIYDPDPNWPEDDTRRVLFQMSSIMKNTHTPISYLVDADWELSQAGESHLFIQANSLDVVNEFCRIVISQLSKPCNALVDVIEKVNLADLINVTNAEFPPTQQHEDTCYASACAAVLNLAMHRIVGREGGIPGFKELRKKLIAKYGEDGKRSEVVLNEVCPEYRLHVRTVDETGARKAINERRPVVARFSLFNEQWKMFMKFYKEKPKGILKKENIEGEGFSEEAAHAVVLTDCVATHLKFMNSWHQTWADEGFFRVEDANVLSDTEFYDVYWTIDDLTEGEKMAFEEKGIERARELLQTFPSIKELSYKCPTCSERSKVGEFSGSILEANCPRCNRSFKPTNEDIIKNLATQNCKL